MRFRYLDLDYADDADHPHAAISLNVLPSFGFEALSNALP